MVTGSRDRTIRVWDVASARATLVLRGPESPITSAAFDPTGTRIVASADRVVWIWRDLEPLRGSDDARLWTATSYCMSIEQRMELLDVSEDIAVADLAECERRTAAARGTNIAPKGSPSSSETEK